MAIISSSTVKILDSAGRPANGRVYFEQSARFESPQGLVTTTRGHALVKDGVISSASGGQLAIPATPADEIVWLFEDFHGDNLTVKWATSIPGVAEVGYSELEELVAPSPGNGVPPWATDILTAVNAAEAAAVAAQAAAEAAQLAAEEAAAGGAGIKVGGSAPTDGWHLDTGTTDPDTTAPTVGTLVASAITSTGFTLTVTGAADETALHATPYAFSTNNGSTWSAYQSSAVFNASGLTASTGYTVRHRVRDAAGNVSTGASQLVTTSAASDVTPPTAGTLNASAITTDGFTLTVTGASDETALHATPYAFSTDGGTTWTAYQASPVYSPTGLTADTGYTCQHRVRDAASNVSTGSSIVVTTNPLGPVSSTFRQSAVDPNNLTTYTFAAQPIGTASASRRVVVAAGWRNSSGTTQDVVSVTIGGVAATIDVNSGLISNDFLILASAVVPTGTTADVVVTVGAVTGRMGIGVWTLSHGGPTGQVSSDSGAAPLNLSVTTAVGDVVIAASFNESTSASAWTGATERYDELVETAAIFHSGADTVAVGTPTAISVSAGAASVAVAAAYV